MACSSSTPLRKGVLVIQQHDNFDDLNNGVGIHAGHRAHPRRASSLPEWYRTLWYFPVDS
ncbi:uncharacterized protein SCHCODRAFT_02617398 [Schizophyllum commune H4-8]|uniref:uncharacterized protein n=1 Tax=Schizophyllum commune (strain H4-8 / FGSC 9210) TaxID=578458 RepID=UPI00215FDF68|nr:uncharacterized protein SCHCODRAFT_02617398 [Schizophyllum commune H4-8]KAI5894616.1 hypothetical protein SCHCODRAFT_02617398 [Schizophyllum commune H4-8]